MASRTVRVLFTGGGSGGHVYPLLSVIESLAQVSSEKDVPLELYYLGPRDQHSALLREYGVRVRGILTPKLRRYFSLLNVIDSIKTPFSFLQALFKVYGLMPDVIFSKGGPGALPVVFAGWFYRIPIIIHESDAVPGLTNLLSSRFASRIAVSFEKTLPYFHPEKTALTGNPIRPSLLSKKIKTEDAKEALGFDPTVPLLLILGGSQGSRRINEFVLLHLSIILQEAQVLHQAGTAHFAEAEKISRAALLEVPVQTAARHRYHIVSYLDTDLATALQAADLIVSRAGSSGISEVAAFGKPSVLIPLAEAANDHQRANAYEFAKTGGANVIEESNLLPGIFINQVKMILKTPGLAARMGEAARTFFKPGAARLLADEVIGLAIAEGGEMRR